MISDRIFFSNTVVPDACMLKPMLSIPEMCPETSLNCAAWMEAALCTRHGLCDLTQAGDSDCRLRSAAIFDGWRSVHGKSTLSLKLLRNSSLIGIECRKSLCVDAMFSAEFLSMGMQPSRTHSMNLLIVKSFDSGIPTFQQCEYPKLTLHYFCSANSLSWLANTLTAWTRWTKDLGKSLLAIGV